MQILQDITQTELTERYNKLKAIKDSLLNATTSPLYAYRQENSFHPVIGEGNHAARVMFVGEAPGENEAKQGRPFCGAAGKFLDVLLAHVGLERESVYITNLIKDRPPNNRDPLPEEIAFYSPFLDDQISIIRPDLVVTLGRFSMAYLFERMELREQLQPISKIHGKVCDGTFKATRLSLLTLYHPAAALYNGGMRQTLLSDFEAITAILGKK
ncbi:MAG: uracil-DNA glycosylase [Candidatus Dojkabacteria bacterium]|nr:MAG: uracil-DNA glycosylase [Candidatus Dojkabacteria bacterium]